MQPAGGERRQPWRVRNRHAGINYHRELDRIRRLSELVVEVVTLPILGNMHFGERRLAVVAERLVIVLMPGATDIRLDNLVPLADRGAGCVLVVNRDEPRHVAQACEVFVPGVEGIRDFARDDNAVTIEETLREKLRERCAVRGRREPPGIDFLYALVAVVFGRFGRGRHPHRGAVEIAVLHAVDVVLRAIVHPYASEAKVLPRLHRHRIREEMRPVRQLRRILAPLRFVAEHDFPVYFVPVNIEEHLVDEFAGQFIDAHRLGDDRREVERGQAAGFLLEPLLPRDIAFRNPRAFGEQLAHNVDDVFIGPRFALLHGVAGFVLACLAATRAALDAGPGPRRCVPRRAGNRNNFVTDEDMRVRVIRRNAGRELNRCRPGCQVSGEHAIGGDRVLRPIAVEHL